MLNIFEAMRTTLYNMLQNIITKWSGTKWLQLLLKQPTLNKRQGPSGLDSLSISEELVQNYDNLLTPITKIMFSR